MDAAPTREDVEVFLYREAALLDDWKLKDWLALFTDDAIYEVPTMDAARDAGTASPKESLFYIADDRFRLGERVSRLGKRGAHAEFPHSRTRHLVSNVLIDGRDDDGLDVQAAFAVHRFKDGVGDLYVGRYRYRLVVRDGALRIRAKRALLDMDSLRPQGRISILL